MPMSSKSLSPKLNVLKVAQATDDIAQNVNFAIKTSVLTSFLDANGVSYSLGCVTKEDLLRRYSQTAGAAASSSSVALAAMPALQM